MSNISDSERCNPPDVDICENLGSVAIPLVQHGLITITWAGDLVPHEEVFEAVNVDVCADTYNLGSKLY